jgi:hypothetical protein
LIERRVRLAKTPIESKSFRSFIVAVYNLPKG